MTKYEVIKSCRQSLWLQMYFYNIFISWTWENVCYLSEVFVFRDVVMLDKNKITVVLRETDMGRGEVRVGW